LVAAVERTKTPGEESWERVAESVSEEVSLAITGQLCKSRFEALEKEKVAQ
jgi:hypothetical protein